jgi:hypothetical protein
MVPIDQEISRLRVERDGVFESWKTTARANPAANYEEEFKKPYSKLTQQIRELEGLQAGGQVGLDLPNHMSASALGWTDLACGNLCPLTR